MKTIPLTRGKVALVDDCDYEALSDYSWQCTVDGYARRWALGGHVWMHRQILNPEKGFDVDHVNGDRLDNRRANLRTATRSQNVFNQTRNRRNTSGRTGVVSGYRGLFYARIKANGKQIHLGSFKTIEEAL